MLKTRAVDKLHIPTYRRNVYL